jgi:amidohydrolase family protein
MRHYCRAWLLGKMGQAIKEAGSRRSLRRSILTSTSSRPPFVRAGFATSDGTCRCPTGHRQRPWLRWNASRVGTALLSVSAPGLWLAGTREARGLARQVNEFAAEQAARHPGRFGFSATLTLPDVEGAMEAVSYALDELYADGIVLPANAGGRYLGDPQFVPLHAKLDQRGALLFIHPTFPAAAARPPPPGTRAVTSTCWPRRRTAPST